MQHICRQFKKKKKPHTCERSVIETDGRENIEDIFIDI